MKLFLRGTFALGISAALASAALSDTPTGPASKAPAGTATTKPAQPPATTTSTGCTTGTVVSGRGHIFGGRLLGGRTSSIGHVSGSHVSGLSGRLDAAGNRIDEIMQKGEERQQRFSEFFNHLAGPPIDSNGQPSGGGKREPKPITQPGTVVFPQHPFARSPRDFFMMEQ